MKSGGLNQGPGSTAVKILVGLGAAAYGINSSLYNGILPCNMLRKTLLLADVGLVSGRWTSCRYIQSIRGRSEELRSWRRHPFSNSLV